MLWFWVGHASALVLDPYLIPKFENELFIPPLMPQSSSSSTDCDYYEIALRQFEATLLPPSMNLTTTVWGYGSLTEDASFASPSFPIEAFVNKCVRIKWHNQLVDEHNNYLPHVIPAVDQNLHWANPAGPIDSMTPGKPLTSYTGPIPMSPHMHGAHTTEDSDGYPTSWFLPNASNIDEYHAFGSTFQDHKSKSKYAKDWGQGAAVCEYPNTQPASLLWFHDHALGVTRLNVYAGAAGAYILREEVVSNETNFLLPQPDIPLVVTDKSFQTNGQLYYPLRRDEGEGFTWAPGFPPYGSPACGGLPNDVKPIYYHEYFGNTILVNGRVWPRLEVSPNRYRFRVLNACNARFLEMALYLEDTQQPMYVIGGDSGFLPQVAEVKKLLLAPAERLDLILDFNPYQQGSQLVLRTLGPGWVPVDPNTTGFIMRFDVTLPKVDPDPSTDMQHLVLPPSPGLPPSPVLAGLPVHRVAIMKDQTSASVRISINNSIASLDCAVNHTFGPLTGLLGSEKPEGGGFMERTFHDEITDIVPMGMQIWEIHSLSTDTHPIHIHQTHFQVLDRMSRANHSIVHPPESWESGFKDTVIANPGDITRIVISWPRSGLSVWHCHILEHEDDEMMRPLIVLPAPADDASTGLSWQAALGLAVGCVAVVGLVGGLAYCVYRRRKEKSSFSVLPG